MIDDKKIEAAARRYSEVTDCDKQEALLIEEGFKEGAKWAINKFLKDLWHTASEEPNTKQIDYYEIADTGSESIFQGEDLKPIKLTRTILKKNGWKSIMVSML